MNKHNETLMKFISTQNQKIREDVSRQGYKDNSPYRNNPFNTIYGTLQGTPITMDGVSKKLRVTDNMGNSEILEPNSGEHFFPGSHVVEEEIPVAQFGKQQQEDLVHDVGNYTNDYMNSPRYKEMLQNSSENTDHYEYINDERFKNLENTNVTFPRPGFKNRFDISISADADTKGTIRMFPHAQGRFASSILAHEFSHAVDRKKNSMTRLIPYKDIELMQNYANSGDIWNHLFSEENANSKSLKEQRDRYLYLSEPTETRARLNDIRFNSKVNNIYDPFNQKVTPDILNGIRDSQTSKAYDDLKEIYTDDQIIDMLNTVSQTNRPPASIPIAKYGGLLNKTITCSNCGWSWKAADGGNDVSTCHKCGNENKVMQQGGMLMRDSDCETCNQLQKFQFAGLAPNDPSRKEYAQRVVQEAERRVREYDYITPEEIPQNVREASAREGKLPYTCIGGACDVYKTAGVLDNINWSNTDFALHAKDYGFTANQGWGLKGVDNLEPGDMIQYKYNLNEQGKYYPSHSRIFLGIDANGKYRFFDNQAKQEQIFDRTELEHWLDPKRKDTEPNAVIFKVNPYSGENPFNLTPEEKEVYDDKQKMIKSDSSSAQEYDWRISKNAKNYNPTTKRVMDKFISFANDNDKINDLVKKTGKSKEDIQDSLLNVFGELGVENNWTTSKGKRLGSKLENIAESVLTAFGGGKKYSVGPGQIKYNSLPEDLKKKYDITSANDLYDLDKVLPLMTSMDLLDKEVLKNWGKNNTLETKLFGVENYDNPFTIEDLPSRNNSDSVLDEGVGRYSPYLRNQYSSIASGTMLEGGNDYIPFNEDVVPNYIPSEYYNQLGTMKMRYERDPGSYPYLVEQNWRNNLERDWIPNNSDQPVELQEVTVKPQFKKGGSYDPLSKFNSVAIETTPKIKNTSNAVELAILINNQASLFNTTNNWLDNL